MISLTTSKGGQAQNYFAAIIFLFVFGILSIFAYLFLSSFITQFDDAGYYEGATKYAGDTFLYYLQWFDWVIVVLMITLIIGAGITTYALAARPVFFIVTFILSAFFGFISYFFNFIFQEIVSNEAFNAVIGYFPKTVYICTNLHWVILALVIVGSIGLFAKKEKGQFLA